MRIASFERTTGAMVVIGNHYAVDRFRGMTWPPSDHDAAQIILMKNVPQRFRCSRKIRDWLHAQPVRRGFGKTMNAMLERSLAGGDRSPQHRRKRRVQCCDGAMRSGLYKALDIGHLAHGHQRLDHLPVGSVPSDEKYLARRHEGGHSISWLAVRIILPFGRCFLNSTVI
jgi:hypothetical protein